MDVAVPHCQIERDLMLVGPALLESFIRSRLGVAFVYALHFRVDPSLNLSTVDSAEIAGSSANPWANSQIACLDDLLFNPTTSEVEGTQNLEHRAVIKFGQIINNFVFFGLV